MRSFLLNSVVLCGSIWTSAIGNSQTRDQPNILWLTCEDTGPQLGCYGDPDANTPRLDALAAKGMRYTRCWSNAPVCAPARTTLISGMWPNGTGSQHMRSEVSLPSSFHLYPHYLKELGYYCTNNAKEDYNLESPKKPSLWHESSGKAHWRNRPSGTPFFAIFNFTSTHESQIRKRPHRAVKDPTKVTLPPFHPDLPEVRQDWAQYHDKIHEMDGEVGKVLDQLQADGLSEDTIVFFYGDHGTGLPRGKRWLYQTGLHVALIVYVPEKFRQWVGDGYRPQGTNDELIGFIDLAPTVISLAGGKVPLQMQGRAALGPQRQPPPKYMYGFRDRMDERYDCSRAVRDERFAYIRNFMPHRPQGQYLEYMFQTPTTLAWKKAFDEDRLTPAQSSFWKPKPPEELYDLETDPHQINNLVTEASQRELLDRMRGALKDWMVGIRDLGLLPEGEYHRRSEGEPPHLMARDPQRFPINRLYTAADNASRMRVLTQLLADSTDADAGIRYWSAVGLTLRGLSHEDTRLDRLVELMNTDSSEYVRMAAAEGIARLGTPLQREGALSLLIKESDLTQRDVFAVTQALNHLAHASPTAKELGARLNGLPRRPLKTQSRVAGYPERMFEYFRSHIIEK